MIFEGGAVGQVDRISDFINYLKVWEDGARLQGNKPFFFTEMGTMANGFGGDNPGVAMYKSLLKDVQLVLRFSQIGIDGFARWNFVNRGNLDGPWQMVDTWDQEKNSLLPSGNYAPHANNYYMWGLLTRFTSKGSEIIKTDVSGGNDGKFQRVFSTTYRSPKNKNYSVFITNDSEQEYETTVSLNKLLGKKFFKYEINEKEHMDRTDININTGETFELSGAAEEIRINLKPKSIILLTTFDLQKTENGIIED